MSSSDTTWFVRQAEATDLPTLVRFNRALAQESEGLDLPEAQVEEGVRRGLEQSDACRYFVVERAGAVVGQQRGRGGNCQTVAGIGALVALLTVIPCPVDVGSVPMPF